MILHQGSLRQRRRLGPALGSGLHCAGPPPQLGVGQAVSAKLSTKCLGASTCLGACRTHASGPAAERNTTFGWPLRARRLCRLRLPRNTGADHLDLHWIKCLGATWEGEEGEEVSERLHRGPARGPAQPAPTHGRAVRRSACAICAGTEFASPTSFLEYCGKDHGLSLALSKALSGPRIFGLLAQDSGLALLTWGQQLPGDPSVHRQHPCKGSGSLQLCWRGFVRVWSQGVVVETRTLAVCGERSAAMLAALRFRCQRHGSGQLPEFGSPMASCPSTQPPLPRLPSVSRIGSPHSPCPDAFE